VQGRCTWELSTHRPRRLAHPDYPSATPAAHARGTSHPQVPGVDSLAAVQGGVYIKYNSKVPVS
jgi:hypothetical protein